MSREGIRRWIAAVRHAMDTGRIGRQISPGPDHIRIRGTRAAPLIGLPPGPSARSPRTSGHLGRSCAAARSTDTCMTRTTMAFAGILSIVLAGPAVAQVVTGGAGNTGVAPPATVGGVPPGTRDLGPSPITRGNEANPSNSSVPGTTPDVNIGGTPTSGPPGTGGTSGGPSLGR